MDILRWRLSLESNARTTKRPGLGLTVELCCRVCRTRFTLMYVQTITPDEVKDGQPHRHMNDPSWFSFAVTGRLALSRYCEDCGTPSIIPPKQAQALIEQADLALDLDWLKQTVIELELRLVQVRETIHHYAHTQYRASRRHRCVLPWRELMEPCPSEPERIKR